MGHQRGRCDKHGVYSEWTGTERARHAWRWEVSPRPSGHMQLDAYHMRRGFVQKTANKVVTMMVNVFFSLIHFWTLLPWWIFYTSADLLLFVLLSTVKSFTMWPHHSHNIFGLPLFLWHCTFPSSIDFFNGWIRLHVRTYFVLLIKFPIWLRLCMDWFIVGLCSVHDTKNISRYHLFSNALNYAFLHVFVQGPRFTSIWQLKICTFIMRCLILLFVAFHSFSMFMLFWMPLPTSVWFCSISVSFYQWPNIF